MKILLLVTVFISLGNLSYGTYFEHEITQEELAEMKQKLDKGKDVIFTEKISDEDKIYLIKWKLEDKYKKPIKNFLKGKDINSIEAITNIENGSYDDEDEQILRDEDNNEIEFKLYRIK